MSHLMFSCAAISLVCWTAIGQGADVVSGVAGSVGGGVGAGNSPRGILPSAAQLHNRAGVNVRGSADGGGRAVGPNFNAARVGVDARLGASAGKSGLRAGSTAQANGRVEGRRHPPANEAPRNEKEQSGESRPTDQSQDPGFRAAMRADLSLATRLAEIDRLRDIALANGDAHMLTRADVLEREARFQHQHQVRQSIGVRAGEENVRANSEFGLSTAERAQSRQRDAAEFGQETVERARQRGGEASEFGQETAERARQHGREMRETQLGVSVDADLQGVPSERPDRNDPQGRGPYDQGPPRGSLDTRATERAHFERASRSEQDGDPQGRGPYDQGPPRGSLDTRATERAHFQGASGTGGRDAAVDDASHEPASRRDERHDERRELRPVSAEEQLRADVSADVKVDAAKRPSKREPKRTSNRSTPPRPPAARERQED